MSSATADTVRSAVDKAPEVGHSLFNGALAEIDPLLSETDDNLVFGLVYWVELLILLIVVLVVTSVLGLGDGKVNFMQSRDKWDSGEYIVLATTLAIVARVVVRKTGSDLFGLSPLVGYSADQAKAFAKKA